MISEMRSCCPRPKGNWNTSFALKRQENWRQENEEVEKNQRFIFMSTIFLSESFSLRPLRENSTLIPVPTQKVESLLLRRTLQRTRAACATWN